MAVITGTGVGQSLFGTPQDDTIYLNGGNNSADGLQGFDTVVYKTNWYPGLVSNKPIHNEDKTIEQYAVVSDDKSLTSGQIGVDSLHNIERIQFNNGVVATYIEDNGTNDVLYRLYKAAFARTPDEGGLKFWSEDRVTPIDRKAASFIDSQEFKTKYGSNVSNNTYVETLYKNVLERSPDAEGLKWWQDKLNSGALNRTEILLNFADSPENVEHTKPYTDHGYWVI